MKTLGYLVFLDAQVRTPVEVDRRRRQVYQAPDLFLQACLHDVFGHHHVALVKILVAPPVAHGTGAMHHRLDPLAQASGQFRVAQVARDKLRAAPHQVLDALGTAPIDPDIEALLQGKTRKASADEAACAGDQNFHLPLRI
ncbi:hypothetical protein D3C76_717910 [compost metagenome]